MRNKQEEAAPTGRSAGHNRGPEASGERVVRVVRLQTRMEAWGWVAHRTELDTFLAPREASAGDILAAAREYYAANVPGWEIAIEGFISVDETIRQLNRSDAIERKTRAIRAERQGWNLDKREREAQDGE